MMQFFKDLFGIGDLEAQIADLVQLNNGLTRELEAYRKTGAQYTTLPIPANESLERLLSDLHASQIFSFYLLALENEIVEMFRTGKGDEAYRGGLNAIRRIREDIKNAYVSVRKHAEVQLP